MVSLLETLLSFLRSLFFRKHLEICVVGLQSAGKTSLVNVLSAGQFSTEVVATIGFSLKRIQSGNTTIKVWDIGSVWTLFCGCSSSRMLTQPREVALTLLPPLIRNHRGQARFRNMWERYCRGVSAIVFVVDSGLPLPGSVAETNAQEALKGPERTHKSKELSTSSANAAWSESAGKGAQADGNSSSAASTIANPWLIATDELHALLTRPQLSGIPLLVLATKNDLPGAAHVDEVIRVM